MLVGCGEMVCVGSGFPSFSANKNNDYYGLSRHFFDSEALLLWLPCHTSLPLYFCWYKQFNSIYLPIYVFVLRGKYTCSYRLRDYGVLYYGTQLIYTSICREKRKFQDQVLWRGVASALLSSWEVTGCCWCEN